MLTHTVPTHPAHLHVRATMVTLGTELPVWTLMNAPPTPTIATEMRRARTQMEPSPVSATFGTKGTADCVFQVSHRPLTRIFFRNEIPG